MKKTVLLISLMFAGASAFAQKTEITLDDAARGLQGITKPIVSVQGWADNEHYYQRSLEGQLEKVNVKTGAVSPYTMPLAPSMARVEVEKGDVFYVSPEGARKQITSTKSEEKNPTLSPDGKHVAFTRDNNLYSVEIETLKESQYTTDGTDLILNGWASWVYYEEILGRESRYKSFWWSPDSEKIVFMRADDSRVKIFPIYNSTGKYGFLELTRYPKTGEENPEIKIGVVETANPGQIVWADFNEKDDQYFGTPYWSSDNEFMVQWMDRNQVNLKIYKINAADGSKREFYDEKCHTWVEWITDMKFVEDGFFMIRDTDGWEQIYHYTNDGKFYRKVTQGNNWGTQIVKVDEKNKKIYYISRAELSTRDDLYCVDFNGKNQRRLTFGDYTHKNIKISPDSKHFITYYSSVSTPTKIALVETKSGKVKEIADSKGEKFDSYNISFPEIVWIKTADGKFEVPARVTWPINLDKNKKYPVIISIYGGPNSATVFDGWQDVARNQWWAKEGVIEITMDHRTSGHCGRKGLDYLHKCMYKWELEDYTNWVKWLYEKPFVDRDKIAIVGGSYGGSMVALALTYGSDYFKYGIANFGVMDWNLYDTHYAERYMKLPKDNPEGYAFGCMMNHISKYKGGKGSMLRVVHGSTDDNVHMQNSLQFIDALQEAGMEFEFMIYPNVRHGWGGNKGVHKHMEDMKFFYQYLLERDLPDMLRIKK